MELRLADYARSLGFPIFPIGLGIGLMTANWFRAGVPLFYFGVVWLAYDAATMIFKHWSLKRRALILIAYIFGIGACSYLWIFIPAPMQIYPSSSVPQFTPDVLFQGIRWLPVYSELDLSVANTGDTDYDNFFAEVSTDLNINALRQINGLSSCTATTVRPFSELIVQHLEHGQPVGTPDIGGVDIGNNRCDYAAVPVFANGMVGPPVGSDTTWRIRCDKLPAHSEVNFQGGLTVINPPNSKVLYGLPRPANWLTMDASFQMYGRTRRLKFSKCQTGRLCVLSRRFDINWTHWTLGISDADSTNRIMGAAVLVYSLCVISCPLALFVRWWIGVPYVASRTGASDSDSAD